MMSNLNENSTNEEIETFLLFHMESADNRKSKINPSLTKNQVWDVHMGNIMKNDNIRVRPILIRNVVAEFGSYYES